MFTGLITEVGKVVNLARDGNARLAIDAGALVEGVRIGDSVAINGVCLTVTAISDRTLAFDVVTETLERTNIGNLKPGDSVNLERSLKAGDEFGGHFVLGHVDGTGHISRLDHGARDVELEIAAGHDIIRYIVEKGSIAVDGISLTVARVSGDKFRVALIPHTLEATNLRFRRPGDRVNLETDIIGKYVERFVRGASGRNEGLTEDKLREMGF